MPTLGMILIQCQELISLFGLEPTSVLEITKGALSDSPFLDYSEFHRGMLTSLPKADDKWPESFPQFDVLSRWAHSQNKWTVYESLLQHMGMTWIPLWDETLGEIVRKDITNTIQTPPTFPASWFISLLICLSTPWMSFPLRSTGSSVQAAEERRTLR